MNNPEDVIPKVEGPVVGWYWAHHSLFASEYPTLLDAVRTLGDAADDGSCYPDVIEDATGTIVCDDVDRLWYAYVDAKANARRSDPDYVPPAPNTHVVELRHPSGKYTAGLAWFKDAESAETFLSEHQERFGDRVRVRVLRP